MAVSVGIDLGTTYSAVAYVPEGSGKPEIILNSEGRKITPSIIQFIGEEAVFGTEAESALAAGEDGCAAAFKRSMGSEAPYCVVGGKTYTATDLSSMLLKKLKQDAEAELGMRIEDAVITVPAYFYSAEREATIQAAKRAGLKVKKLIDEPNAAAMAYGLNHWRENANILVYDLGGGTFDVTLTNMEKGGILRTIVTRGDHILGGRDWDDRMAGILTAKLENETGLSLQDRESGMLIRGVCEGTKKKLSSMAETSVRLSLPDYGYADISVSRTEFEEATADLIERTGVLCRAVIEEAGIRLSDVSDVLLVGGSTRMPQVSLYLMKIFGKKPISHVNPDEAVALGAAIQATKDENAYTKLSVVVKNGKKETDRGKTGLALTRTVKPSRKLDGVGTLSIQETTAHAMGMIAVNPDGTRYINDIIIPANHPRPVKAAKAFYTKTIRDKENEMEIFVLQGDRENPLDNQIPFRYVVSGIKHILRQRGNTLVRVQYSYDRNGVIQIEARQEQDNFNLPIRRETVPSDMSVYGRPIENAEKTGQAGSHVGIYSKWAGVSRIPATNMDRYGNALGDEFDLIEDGTFEGELIFILNLCPEAFDLSMPINALSKKGFKVVNQRGVIESTQFKSGLEEATQLWVISDRIQHLEESVIGIIEEFFHEGHGVYIWGDNDPYYADANLILYKLFGIGMSGDSPGDQVVSLYQAGGNGGIIEDHLISTGIENMYEGITIAAVGTNDKVKPLVYGSNGLVVTAYYDENGRRALIDGGFTRLYYKWDSAGTDRYVVNAAAWLVNLERFADKYNLHSNDKEAGMEEDREVETWD